MDFQNYLQTAAQDINQELKSFLSHWLLQSHHLNPRLQALNKLLVESCEGGKRIRGTMVKLGYELAGGEPNMEILKPAAAVEVFQTGILIHDDVIDLSPTRRGKPTVYRALGGNHYGASQAICLGDVSFFLATKMLSESAFQSSLKARAVSIFSDMVINTGWGEMMDVELPYSNQKKTENDVLSIQKLKTADYTITYPLMMGASLAGAPAELLASMTRFGESLGIAFQIQDDILGVFGDEKTLGKSVTSDIEEGKNTLLIVYALEHANKDQKAILDQYYGKGKISLDQLAQIRQVFIDTGALNYSQKKAQELVDQAKKNIESMAAPTDKKLLLTQMADFMVQRKY